MSVFPFFSSLTFSFLHDGHPANATTYDVICDGEFESVFVYRDWSYQVCNYP